MGYSFERQKGTTITNAFQKKISGWVFVYELSGCGFESCCSHLKYG